MRESVCVCVWHFLRDAENECVISGDEYTANTRNEN